MPKQDKGVMLVNPHHPENTDRQRRSGIARWYHFHGASGKVMPENP